MKKLKISYLFAHYCSLHFLNLGYQVFKSVGSHANNVDITHAREAKQEKIDTLTKPSNNCVTFLMLRIQDRHHEPAVLHKKTGELMHMCIRNKGSKMV